MALDSKVASTNAMLSGQKSLPDPASGPPAVQFQQNGRQLGDI
jgi:hypothetical protein